MKINYDALKSMYLSCEQNWLRKFISRIVKQYLKKCFSAFTTRHRVVVREFYKHCVAVAVVVIKQICFSEALKFKILKCLKSHTDFLCFYLNKIFSSILICL
ncbi:hypothetical protein T4B_312 [Trichinella pseudospiralis]|uniref:Uncharacterized protein n=1 Tax=Trichinella pseudospiralis TaxID=6337 RepID=A0A0V1IPG5_TRIPS|nr:hypothetical protein T4B_312 [Trichinella pseudospiralis]